LYASRKNPLSFSLPAGHAGAHLMQHTVPPQPKPSISILRHSFPLPLPLASLLSPFFGHRSTHSFTSFLALKAFDPFCYVALIIFSEISSLFETPFQLYSCHVLPSNCLVHFPTIYVSPLGFNLVSHVCLRSDLSLQHFFIIICIHPPLPFQIFVTFSAYSSLK